MIGHPNDHACRLDLMDRVFRPFTGLGIHNMEHVIQKLACSFLEAPASKCLCHRVHPGNPASGICSNNPVAD